MDITVVMHKGLTYAVLLGSVLVSAYLAVLTTERATVFSIPPLVAGTLIFASGLWILLKNPRAVTNRTFSLLCLAVCLWLFSVSMIYSTADPQNALFWGKFLYGGVVYIPALFYHFCVSFLERPGHRRTIWLNYTVSTAFFMLIPTSLLINGQYSFFWGWYPKAGLLHPLFLVFFAAVGARSLHMLYSSYNTATTTAPLEATRIKFVLWAFLLALVASVDFAPSYGIEFYPGGFVFVSLWVLLVSYAVAKYRLLEISLIVSKNKILPYAQGFAILFSFYVATLLLVHTFTGSIQYTLAALLLALLLVSAELLVKIPKRMEEMIGRALFREKHDAYDTLTAFSKDMVTILDLKDLNQRFLGTLSKALKIPRVSLFLLDEEKLVYTLVSSKGLEADQIKGLKIPSEHPLVHQLARSRSLLVREELEYAGGRASTNPIIDCLRSMRSDVCLPLFNKGRLIGFCNLGTRANDQMYSGEDLSLLKTLAQNAAIALDNALLYEHLKRSQLLMQRTDRLRSLETIAGGFAHEIRNPLTSIKTFIQLAPERKDDPEFIDGFSRIVNDDVLRIERLIEEILDYARYMRPQLTEEDINDVVTSCLYFVQFKADSLGITLENALALDLPRVMLDRQQMKQVILNLLLNALDAMREKGGCLTVKTHGLKKPAGDEWVQFEVSDTGPGIEAASLEQIFDPFYTTKHDSGEREGTGLGLSIVHQIVQEHHGIVQVESAVGKGTTFLVNLPASPAIVAPSSLREEHEEAGPVGR